MGILWMEANSSDVECVLAGIPISKKKKKTETSYLPSYLIDSGTGLDLFTLPLFIFLS